MNQSFIRNFAIIAHIDHGKSTLADRLLEMTGTVAKRDMQEQILDSNPIERERGITIKLAPVRMVYSGFSFPEPHPVDQEGVGDKYVVSREERQKSLIRNTNPYILNLIDTPGHVDFSYEVSRSLAACEGAILVVDATQGVQAQTLAHLTQARKHNLAIIPVINKIDLPNAQVEETWRELSGLGLAPEEFSPLPLRHIDFISPIRPILVSAKTGQNVEQVFEAIIKRIPPPYGEPDQPLRALVFSSQYDSHKGVVVFVRVVDGTIVVPRPGLAKQGQALLKFMASQAQITPIEAGYFSPKMLPCDTLRTGEVGYIATGLKDVKLAKVGDTVTVNEVSTRRRVDASTKDIDTLTHRCADAPIAPLPGYHEPKSMVFVGLFPACADNYHASREAMERLRLSDSAFTFRPISSAALGNGFHCGFLGLLHAEIVQERLSREFDLNMIATAPSVEYRLTLTSGASAFIQSASEYPDPAVIDSVEEPVMKVSIIAPRKFVGSVMQLSQEKRGQFIDLSYQSNQSYLSYYIPLSEMIIDFFDRLKSVTEGYASLDYEFFDYQSVELAKLDVLVNHEKIDALAFLIVKDQARKRGKEIVERLVEVLPRQQFTVPVQAAIGGDIIARQDIKSFRKDVTAKLYGGDRTRKDKLLEAQKKGKARMKRIGSVDIPQTAFFEVLKRE